MISFKIKRSYTLEAVCTQSDRIVDPRHVLEFSHVNLRLFKTVKEFSVVHIDKSAIHTNPWRLVTTV